MLFCGNMRISMLYDTLKKYYAGFSIAGPKGNNAFSYERRVNKFIYVPPLIDGGVDSLAVSEDIAFSEIVDGVEVNCSGLKNFVIDSREDGKAFIIFDNHNHAFFFWCAALNAGLIKKGAILAHVDQHTDMRNPPYYLSLDSSRPINLEEAFAYTQGTLNVGCFIKPALEAGIFSSVVNIQNSDDFKKDIQGGIVLDIDIDIFAPQMDYIPDEIKLDRIKSLVRQASLITIATSPFFIEQGKAIDWVKKIIE